MIRDAKGSNAKKEVLRTALKDKMFALYVKEMYDFDRVFGIRKIDKTITGSMTMKKASFPILLEAIINFKGRRSGDNVKEVEAILKAASTNEVPYLYDFIDRDMKAGCSKSTINKVWKELHGEVLIPEFKVGLCMDYRPAKLTYPLYVEPKMDGMRILAFVEDGQVTYRSRNGKEKDIGERFDFELLDLAGGYDVVFDGELMGLDFDNTMTQANRKKNRDLSQQYFHIFDVITKDQWEAKETDDYEERKNILHKLWREGFDGETPESLIIVEDVVVKEQDEMENLCSSYLKAGFEGVILKQNKPYPFKGKSSPTWMKFKPFLDVDLEIVDITEGTNKYKGMMGAIVVINKGKKVQVGSGFSDKQRKWAWKNPNQIIGKIAEIKYQDETKDNSLRFPIFKGLRPDKE